MQAVVDGYDPLDFLQMDAHRDLAGPPADDHESMRLPSSKRTADPDSFESLLSGAPIEERPDLVRAASPLTYARPKPDRSVVCRRPNHGALRPERAIIAVATTLENEIRATRTIM